MITIAVLIVISIVGVLIYKNWDATSADGIVSTFTKAIVKLEAHAEDKIKEALSHNAAVEAALKLKADAEAEVQKAKDYAAKLKGIFN